jgi:RNAse (barnase) inhibitor barstar
MTVSKTIEIKWQEYQNIDQFYDDIAMQCELPIWFGRNLDALADVWVTGGIDKYGPPYLL